MSWYSLDGIRTALRKHMLRVDLRVYCGDPTTYQTPSDQQTLVKSILSAAIVQGLDIVGIVSPNGPEMGWMALQTAKQTDIDLWVVPGQDYTTTDKIELIVYGLKQPIQPGLTSVQVCHQAHKERGFVMWSNPTKHHAAMFNKAKGNPSAPDAVEIYSAMKGGFQDIAVDLPKFITSGAKSAKEIEDANVFTLINRKEWEALGLMPEGEGADYVPPYLEREDQMQDGADPSAVADGTVPQQPVPQAGIQ